MPIWPFPRSRAAEDAVRLLAAVQGASRRPEFFGAGRISDTLEGRFELAALNAALALIRLKTEPGAERLAQEFTDFFFRSLDAGLREAAVGDLSVPKKMRRMAGDFYGRLGVYADAIAANNQEALAAAIARNVVTAEAEPFARTLASYMAQTAHTQAAAPLDALFASNGWGDL